MRLDDKFQVGIAFAFRLAVIPVSAVHLAYIFKLAHSTNPQLMSTGSLILQQVMIGVSLLACTIPSLKSFMRSFSMGMGVMQFESSTGDRTHPSQDSYALRTIGGGRMNSHVGTRYAQDTHKSRAEVDKTRVPGAIELRGDQAQTETIIHSDGGSHTTLEDGNRMSRMGSQDMIIRKDVQWDVQHES